MKVSFASEPLPNSGVLVFVLPEVGKLSSLVSSFDKTTKGQVKRAIKVSGFTGKKGEELTLIEPHGTKITRLILVGLGASDKANLTVLKDVGGIVAKQVETIAEKVSVSIQPFGRGRYPPEEAVTQFALGAMLRSYRFDKYLTKKNKDKLPILKTLIIHSENSSKIRQMFKRQAAIVDGVFLTRNLVTEPANILYPAEFAFRVKKELKKLGVKVSILTEKDMKKHSMGALLGVAQGSSREARLVVMEWDGLEGKSKRNDKPLAFIGKGVCFDTGGISLKPAGGMEDMKWDMGGAGVVAGLIKTLALRKSKTHAIGAIGLVENMPDGNAQRPGDIVKSMSGQTIEVLNTDAEGRLVLCDVLHYVNKKYKPKFLVDLATLTGAIIISLGYERAGLFSNNDELAKNLLKSGEATGEKLWRLPLGEEYDKLIDSDIADIKNISGGRGAGSITAAQFLARFVGETPWAHLDIAGVTWSKKDTATVPKGGTAYGVQLLEYLIKQYYE
ncbi:MAG: Cytosol aminopeptidase [Alphaproteobacteria bacterium MarineAlpha3_Bin5]|nr:leucyl aminopeptidase [Magnetovibrio sp.]PPR75433.1 MAG: Cytosol aminopeptidase [Alphaproteobacteria bacterium MarineAlpha3_Bin5]